MTLGEIEQALRASWGVDTCDPAAVGEWSAGNAARGQCGVTALVVQDLLGGDLVCADVLVDGQPVGHHWWNRFAIDLDLTGDQFSARESVTPGRVRVRPPGPPRRCQEQYELLRLRVFRRLGLFSGDR